MSAETLPHVNDPINSNLAAQMLSSSEGFSEINHPEALL
jgi:hypothetical protein